MHMRERERLLMLTEVADSRIAFSVWVRERGRGERQGVKLPASGKREREGRKFPRSSAYY